MTKIDVSIIVPLFHGKEYLLELCVMLNKCIMSADAYGIAIEVIFINDLPEEIIEDSCFDTIRGRYKYLVNNENKGIHYTRVRGVEESSGEYVLFLDQDDIISQEYIRIQLERIGDADVAVCFGYDEGEIIRNCLSRGNNHTEIEEYTNTVNTYLGTELIRKNAIPELWKKNIVRINGADDVFLNLLLRSENKAFVFRQDILYCHVNTGKNTSMDYRRNIESLEEVNRILYNKGLINKDSLKLRIDWGRNWLASVESLSNSERKDKWIIHCLNIWMKRIEEGYSLEKWLLDRDINSVVIYGMGLLGKHVFDQLSSTRIHVHTIMDNNVTDYCGKKCKKKGERIDSADAIILTVYYNSHELQDELMAYYNTKILHVSRILTSMVEFSWDN